ncbi:hypothetical protein DNL40_05520 [Xylanimonas oleitrophica]|uniref:N-acetylmuramoyl-L-alanine amidase n=1 Tax=Xylanimonas oleitrophica TaxID=2607479 RepID=A0A2W5X0V7_9MICO|nr:peptidoglycan recognition protein [Xylanimonas oleitrophica]PZR54356.1 hypothetical protein DNL40_05520 [Xylanimonas oleitrophica]
MTRRAPRRNHRNARALAAALTTTALLVAAIPGAAADPGTEPDGAAEVTAEQEAAAAEPVAPVEPSVTAVEAEAPTEAQVLDLGPAADGTATTTDTDVVVASSEVTGFATVGVVWEGPSTPDVAVHVRTADADGTWGEWTDLEIEPGPEGGSTGGTAPLVVGDVAHAEAKIEGAEAAGLRDVRLSVIDPGTGAVDARAASTSGPGYSPAGRSAVPAAPADQFTGGPTVLSRADWGADERLATWRPTQGDYKAAVIHHTAGTNDYSAAQVPAILRGIYAYHAQQLGWGDIGYNFLVDKFGRIWEGRVGGIEMETIGAHVSGWNTNSVGVSVLGNYQTATVTNQAVDAIVRLLGWKMSLQGIRANSTVSINGRTINTIVGHRDLAATSCPGASLYNRLGEIRSRVAAEQGRYQHIFGQGTTFLIQGAGAPQVYLVNGTTKYHIKNYNTLTSLSNLGRLLYADLRVTNQLANGPEMRRFVRDDRSGRVAFVDNNLLYHATICEDVRQFGVPCTPEAIPLLAPVEWDRLGQGPRLSRAVTSHSTDRVYFVQDGRKRWVRSWGALERLLGMSPPLTWVSQGALDDLPNGPDIH